MVYEKEFRRHVMDQMAGEKILCLDPGETVGWSLFENCYLRNFGQLEVKKVAEGSIDKKVECMRDFIHLQDPTICVAENYIVYAHKAKEHAWNELFTAKLIGNIEAICNQFGTPLYYQMAQEAKFFGTDEKLKKWGLYQTKMKHANDSIRHGLYFMLKESQARKKAHT